MAHTLQVATPVLRARAYLGIAAGLLPAEGDEDQ